MLRAHVTVFHALPDEACEEVRRAADRPAFPATVERVRSLGRGVAYDLRSPAAQALRADLAHLAVTPQDRQPGWRPHVTVQNKVTPAAARETLALLAARFSPYDVQVTGLRLWDYLDGPWRLREELGFRTD